MQTLTSSSLNPSLHLPNKETLTSTSHSPPNPRNPLALFNRRHLLLYVSISPSLLSLPIPAAARGLFQMPPPRLNNRYFLVRAGESEYERIGIINTNPVAKTSVDNGLSEEGKRQTARAAVELKAMGACEGDCWIWPSITQRSYQAAEVIAFVNGVNRSHIVPEYSFLDARGLGSYEGRSLDSIKEVYASDSISPNTKPPPIDNGTPNESVADVFVRVTQLMSVIETQYSGDTVIIVSPDSDNLTVLQAGLVGLDLRSLTLLRFSHQLGLTEEAYQLVITEGESDPLKRPEVIVLYRSGISPVRIFSDTPNVNSFPFPLLSASLLLSSFLPSIGNQQQ